MSVLAGRTIDEAASRHCACGKARLPASVLCDGVHPAALPRDGLTKSSSSAQCVLMDFLTRESWRLVHDPTLESTKKRQDAGKRDILDDGELGGMRRYESASESGGIEDPRWNVPDEDDMPQTAAKDIAAFPCHLQAARAPGASHMSCSVTHSHSGSRITVVVQKRTYILRTSFSHALTLVTIWVFTSSLRRIILVAERVDVDTEILRPNGERTCGNSCMGQ